MVCTAANAVPVNSAESSDNPYQNIVDRNVFSLKPPPPPPDPTEVAKPTALKITLTGITTILGNKRVLMKTPPPPGKPGEGPKTEQSYILTEGQREGDIEVLEIDDKAGSVKVNNAGTIQTLTFEKDGAKLPSTPAPVGVQGIPGQLPGQLQGLPVNHPNFPAPTANGTAPSFQLPTRIPRLPVPGGRGTGGIVPNGMGGGMAGAGITPSYGAPGYLPGNTITPINTGVGGPGTTTTSPSVGGQYSAEEQAILIEAERQAGGPTAALLPPTILTPKANPAEPGGQNSQLPRVILPPMPGRPPVPGQY